MKMARAKFIPIKPLHMTANLDSQMPSLWIWTSLFRQSLNPSDHIMTTSWMPSVRNMEKAFVSPNSHATMNVDATKTNAMKNKNYKKHIGSNTVYWQGYSILAGIQYVYWQGYSILAHKYIYILKIKKKKKRMTLSFQQSYGVIFAIPHLNSFATVSPFKVIHIDVIHRFIRLGLSLWKVHILADRFILTRLGGCIKESPYLAGV